MKLVLRFQGQPFHTFEPDLQRTYTIGRHSDNDIHFAHAALSRHQGILKFEGHDWIFEDLKADKNEPTRHRIAPGCPLNHKNGLEILFEEDAQVQHTRAQVHIPRQAHGLAPHKARRKLYAAFATLGIAIVALSGAVTFQAFHGFDHKLDAKDLRSYGAERVVRFEFVLDADQKEKLLKSFGKDDLKDTAGFCTGFHMGNGLVVTAAHCLYGENAFNQLPKATLKTNDDQPHEIENVVALDYALDYAVLNVPSMAKYASFKWAEKWELGQKVFTMGNVAGQGLAIREGLLSAETPDETDNSIKYFRFSAPASPGNSGGPLLTEQGAVLGVVSASSQGENYNIGIEGHFVQQAISEFVTLKAKHQIVYDSRKHATFAQGPSAASMIGGGGDSVSSIAMTLNLPVLNGSLVEKNVLQKGWNNVQVTIDLPQKPNAILAELVAGFSKAYMAKYDGAVQTLKDKGLATIGWENQVTKEKPALVPVQSSYADLISQDPNGQLQFGSAMLLDAPGDSSESSYMQTAMTENGMDDALDEKSSAFSVQMMPMGPIPKRMGDAKRDFTVETESSLNTDETFAFGTFAHLPIKVTFNGAMPEEKAQRQAVLDSVNAILFGKGGMKVSAQMIPFLKPNASMDVLVKQLPEEFAWSEVKDDLARPWLTAHTSVYNIASMQLACLAAGRSLNCVLDTTEDQSLVPEIQKILAENQVKYRLRYMLPVGTSFSPDELVRDGAAGSNFADFQFSKSANGELVVKLGQLGKTLNLGPASKISAVQPVAGIVNTKDGGKWTALSVRAIRSDGRYHELCTAGFDIKDRPYDEWVRMVNEDNKMMDRVNKLAKVKTLPAKARTPASVSGLDYQGVGLQSFGLCGQLTNESLLGEDDAAENGKFFLQGEPRQVSFGQ